MTYIARSGNSSNSNSFKSGRGGGGGKDSGGSARPTTVVHPQKASTTVGSLNSALESLSVSKQSQINHFKTSIREAAVSSDRSRVHQAERSLNRHTNEAASSFKQLVKDFPSNVTPGPNAGIRQTTAAFNAHNNQQAQEIRQITTSHNRENHNHGAVTSVRQHFGRGNQDQARGLQTASRRAAGGH